MNVSFRTFFKNRRGNAGTEFAFILPIMLLFIGGIVEFGRFFLAYNEANRLASRYAIVYADCSDSALDAASWCTSSAHPTFSLQNTFASSVVLGNLVPQLTAGSVAVRMFYVTMSAAGAAQTYKNAYPVGATFDSPSTATVPTNTELQSAKNATSYGGNPQAGDVVVVTITYTHQLLFFSKIMGSFLPPSLLTVTYTVAQRKT